MYPAPHGAGPTFYSFLMEWHLAGYPYQKKLRINFLQVANAALENDRDGMGTLFIGLGVEDRHRDEEFLLLIPEGENYFFYPFHLKCGRVTKHILSHFAETITE